MYIDVPSAIITTLGAGGYMNNNAYTYFEV